ncbi:phosphonate ABC transporter ATP-binding protein [Peptococcaceae bacterium]|nr:phosphonate ABC transporter ATP-binding protein [Peptococcaceae bacterium]
MLAVKGITKKLPDGRMLLSGISFEVKKGEFVGILGKSGVGKTVLLRCINGLTKPDSGEILLDVNGSLQKVNDKKEKKLRKIRQYIGMIFQGSILVKRLSVLENVLTGRLGRINTIRSLLYGFTNKEVNEALSALERVGVKHLAGRRAETLSGGEMQRVAIARALFQQPCLLLADEPVSNLDPKNTEIVLDYLKPLTKSMAIIAVFHSPELVSKYCTRAIAIKNGTVVYDGNPHLSSSTLEYIYDTKSSVKSA